MSRKLLFTLLVFTAATLDVAGVTVAAADPPRISTDTFVVRPSTTTPSPNTFTIRPVPVPRSPPPCAAIWGSRTREATGCR